MSNKENRVNPQKKDEFSAEKRMSLFSCLNPFSENHEQTENTLSSEMNIDIMDSSELQTETSNYIQSRGHGGHLANCAIFLRSLLASNNEGLESA